MSNSNTDNCIEVLSANNSYCYNQYIQEGNNLIRENIRRTPALGRSDIEKERRTNKRTCFINDQLVNDLQQIMPLPAVSLSDLPSDYMDSQSLSENSRMVDDDQFPVFTDSNN